MKRRMTREQYNLVRAKREVFNGYRIPWDSRIESRFVAMCDKYPNSDPEVLLDQITHDIIIDKTDGHDAMYNLNLLHKHFPNKNVIYKHYIIDVCGHDGFEKMHDMSLIKCVGFANGCELYDVK